MSVDLHPPTDTQPKTETLSELDLDLEREWEEARARAGLSPRAVEPPRPRLPGIFAPVISPYVMLYSGFFLGPLATLLLTLWALPRRATGRQTVLLVSAAGVTWCLVQGLTWMLLGEWASRDVQLLRTGLNLALGTGFLMVLRAQAARLVHTRDCLLRTMVVAGLILVSYFMIQGTAAAVWLGR